MKDISNEDLLKMREIILLSRTISTGTIEIDEDRYRISDWEYSFYIDKKNSTGGDDTLINIGKTSMLDMVADEHLGIHDIGNSGNTNMISICNKNMNIINLSYDHINYRFIRDDDTFDIVMGLVDECKHLYNIYETIKDIEYKYYIVFYMDYLDEVLEVLTSTGHIHQHVK